MIKFQRIKNWKASKILKKEEKGREKHDEKLHAYLIKYSDCLN